MAEECFWRWECPNCKNLNLTNNEKCTFCKNYLPTLERKMTRFQRMVPIPGTNWQEIWKCPSCTISNPASKIARCRCRFCGVKRDNFCKEEYFSEQVDDFLHPNPSDLYGSVFGLVQQGPIKRTQPSPVGTEGNNSTDAIPPANKTAKQSLEDDENKGKAFGIIDPPPRSPPASFSDVEEALGIIRRDGRAEMIQNRRELTAMKEDMANFKRQVTEELAQQRRELDTMKEEFKHYKDMSNMFLDENKMLLELWKANEVYKENTETSLERIEAAIAGQWEVITEHFGDDENENYAEIDADPIPTGNESMTTEETTEKLELEDTEGTVMEVDQVDPVLIDDVSWGMLTKKKDDDDEPLDENDFAYCGT